MEKRSEERERLETLSRYQILDTPDEPAFDDLTRLASHFCRAPVSLISFLDGEREWFKSKEGTTVREVPRDHAFADRVIRNREFIVIPDATADDELRENPLVKRDPHLRFFAGCPLISRDGHALGAFCILDREPHELDAQEQQMLRVLSHEAMTLLELRRELYESRNRNQAAAAEIAELRSQLNSEVAKRQELERKLEWHEEQLADVQRITHLGSWQWDLRTNTITWSDELYRIYGVQPHEFEATYAAYLRFVHPEDRGRASKAVEDALVTNGSFTSEERIIRADGSIRVLSTHGEVIRNEKGEAVRMVGCCHDITQRKTMENELHHSLSLLHAALESTADGLLIVDLNGRVVRFNRKFAELWHLPRELVNLYDDERLLRLVLEQLEDPEGFLHRVKELYANLDADSFDVVDFKDGRTFERYSCPQRLNGKVIGRVWSFRDVTARCRALNVLRESEERYRSLVVATAQVVWSANVHGAVVEDSPSWRAFTGQTYLQMRDRGWLNAVHPRDRSRVMESWQHSLNTGSIYEIEFRVRHVDGEWRYMAVRGVPVRGTDGSVREWVGYCRDITTRKKAEETIVHERDLSHAIINSLPGIFYLLDETGLNLRWNYNLEKVTGFSPQEISRMHAIDFVPEEEKVTLAQRVHKVFLTGEADVELNLLTNDGRRIPHYCTGKMVRLNGKPHLVGMGIDISKLKYAEEEIRRLNTNLEGRVEERTAQLNAANKEMESFTYTASHDLRAPIRAIVGFARVLQEETAKVLSGEQQMYLQRISEAGNRMMQLIDDLLSYCQLGRQAVHLRPIPLGDVLHEIASDFSQRVRALEGHLSIPDHMPHVIADATLLRQVFWNLFDNAVTYRKQSIPPEIKVSCVSEGDHVLICVCDNGIGIAPEHQQRIFEVFQRLHGEHEYSGTGVGLASVKKAVEKLGGTVWVESQVGQGSTFCIGLKRVSG